MNLILLLIDFKVINVKTHEKFLKNIKDHIPNTKYNLVLALVIPIEQLNILDNLEKGKQKIEYLNNEIFIRDIQEHNFIINKDKICQIINPTKSKYIKLYIEKIESEFTDSDIILVSIPIKNKKIIQKYTQKGFGKPYICSKKYGMKMIKTICLRREKGDNNDYSNKINDILFHGNFKYCKILLKLENKTINKLKLLCEETDLFGTQKEQAGNMVAIQRKNNKYYNIEINDKSVIKGTDTGVDIVSGLYNFHSHPRNAYKIYNVKLGWPSAQDYIGFFISIKEDSTIFHIVSTLEGIYIISLSKDWILKQNFFSEEILDFIEKKYNFCYKEGNTIKWYLDKVNNIKYKDSIIFTIKYLQWEKANTIFSITYSKLYNNCFTCDKTKYLFTEFCK